MSSRNRSSGPGNANGSALLDLGSWRPRLASLSLMILLTRAERTVLDAIFRRKRETSILNPSIQIDPNQGFGVCIPSKKFKD